MSGGLLQGFGNGGIQIPAVDAQSRGHLEMLGQGRDPVKIVEPGHRGLGDDEGDIGSTDEVMLLTDHRPQKQMQIGRVHVGIGEYLLAGQGRQGRRQAGLASPALAAGHHQLGHRLRLPSSSPKACSSRTPYPGTESDATSARVQTSATRRSSGISRTTSSSCSANSGGCGRRPG
ncbi:MAG: hypothetical protein WDA75_02270 [Candidatus Latescibacterota bacterium]